MTDDALSIAADSWRFALALYAKPGVSAACLQLQDDAGVDVMLLLVALFAASHRCIALTDADLIAMDAVVRPWREQVVQPLRALRCTLKSGPSPAPSAMSDRLRERIKASELDAERIANDRLAVWLLSSPSERDPLTDVQIRRIVIEVVRHTAGTRIDRVTPAIETILAAMDDGRR
jgi:uncharacterized protein (TIGR02444 family)